MKVKNIKSKIIIATVALVLLSSVVGSNFFDNKSSYVAKIHGEKISVADFSEAYRERLQYVQSITNQKLSKDELLEIKKEVLMHMIEEKSLSVLIDKIGLKIGLDVVKEHTKKIPSFLDKNGKFDTAKFKEVLSSIHMSEGQYADKMMDNLPKAFLIDSLMGDNPNAYAFQFDKATMESLYSSLYQSRVVDIVEVDRSFLSKTQNFTENEVQSFYEKNKDLFKTREMRAFSFAEFNHELFDKEPVDNVKLEQIMKQKSNDMQVDFYNIIIETEKEANSISKKITSGEKTFEEIVKKKLKDSDNYIKNIYKSELPPSFASKIFSLKTNQISNPIKSNIGWHIIKIVSFHKPSDSYLKNIRRVAEQTLREEQLSQIMQKKATLINEEMLKGMTLEEVTKKYNIPLKTVPSIYDNNVDSSGKHFNVPDDIIDIAFSLKTERTENFHLSNDGRFVAVSVNKLIKPTQESFQEAKIEVSEILSRQKTNSLLLEKTKSLMLKYLGGMHIEKIKGVTVHHDIEINRPTLDISKENALYPIEMTKQAFDTKKLSYTRVYLFNNKAYIATVKNVIISNRIDPQKFKNLQNSYSLMNIEFLRGQFFEGLRMLYNPTINKDLIEK